MEGAFDLPFREIWVLLQQWGAPGAIILVMGWWIWRIEKDKAELITKMLTAYEKGSALADANTKATSEWVQANAARTKALDTTVDAIRMISSSQGVIIEKVTAIAPDVKELTVAVNKLREGLIEFRARFLGKE